MHRGVKTGFPIIDNRLSNRAETRMNGLITGLLENAELSSRHSAKREMVNLYEAFVSCVWKTGAVF